MRKLFLSIIFIATTLISCGQAEDGEAGKPGVVGPQGPSGKPGEEGKPGKPADPATSRLVVSRVRCELSTQVEESGSGYPKFELSYQKTILNDESALIVLAVRKKFNELSSGSYESHMAFYVKGEAGYNLAAVESTLWKAELAGPNEVKFSYKPSSLIKTASCK